MRYDTVQQALDILRGAVMIVYPMGLPPHEPVRDELENMEDLSGTQVGRFIYFKKMLMVLCTLFIHIDIIPILQKIHLI